jgi:lipopolysaccharide export system permease protein
MTFIKIIDRYIFKLALVWLLSLGFVITSIIWLAQSIRFLEIIVNTKDGLIKYFSVIIYIIPELLAITLPICLLISGLAVFQRLIGNNELTVLKATGHSNFQIAKPFLFLCFLSVIFSTFVNAYLTPHTLKKFNAYREIIQNDLSSSIIHPGAFNKLKNNVIYVQNDSKQDRFKGVFAFIRSEDGKTQTILVAESGFLEKNDSLSKLILVNGFKQELDIHNNQISRISFENFSYDIKDIMKNTHVHQTRPYERSMKELLNPTFVEDAALKNRMIVEGHQRLILPWICFVNGMILVSIMLFGEIKRRQRMIKGLASVTLSAFFHVLIVSLLENARQDIHFLWIAYLMVAFFIILFGIVLSLSRWPVFNKNNL